MKRLSKSASDLSGCKKRTHSTSPEEEQPPGCGEAGDSEFECEARPSSAASHRSVPEDGVRSSRSKKKHKDKHKSEVGIRNVAGQIHHAYRGHQVSSLSPVLNCGCFLRQSKSIYVSATWQSRQETEWTCVLHTVTVPFSYLLCYRWILCFSCRK